MTTLAFLANLRQHRIKLWADGDRLHYSAPSGALTQSLRQELGQRKTEILQFLRHATAQPVSSKAPIGYAPRDRPLPLSFAQQRLWFMDQLEPGSAYNLAEALKIGPGLDMGSLQEALGAMVNRHEILRTNYTINNGAPQQTINPPRPVEMAHFDLRDCPDADMQLRRILKQEAGRPFDLAHDLMLRTALVNIDGQNQAFLLVTHGIACDSWAMGILFEELSALYNGFSTNQPPKVAYLRRQYADYAYWQREWMQADVMDTLLAYWRQRLDAPLPTLDLPTDRPRSPLQTHRGATQAFAVPQSVTALLKALNIESGVTPFMTLQAVFQILLHRLTGQTDIVIGSPVGVYNHFEVEPLIGYWANILVLRCELAGAPTFRQLLQRTRANTLEAYTHQELPFDKLVETLQPERDPSRHPLFQVLFLFLPHSAPGRALSRCGLDIEPLAVERDTAMFDLTLSMAEDGERLVGEFEYNTDLFDDETITRWKGNFQSLIEAVAANPDIPIAALPFLTDDATVRKVGPERQALPTPVGDRDQPSIRTDQAHRDRLELQLTKLWEQVLERRPIGLRDNFFDLGGHSLLAAYLFNRIETHILGEKLPLALLFQAPTIEQLAETIRNRGWSSSWTSLVPIKPEGTKPPLYFVHAHGGDVIGYSQLARCLPKDQPFYGIQAQALDQTDLPPQRFEEMAAHYIREIKTVQPTGPYCIGGWCLGGDVALEMAHQLTALDDEVSLVILLENPRPAYYLNYKPGTTALHKRFYQLTNRLDLELTNIWEVGADRRGSFALARTKRLWRTLLGAGEKKLNRLLAQFNLSLPSSRNLILNQLAQSHNKAYSDYRPKPYHGRTLLLRATKQLKGIIDDPTLGWKPYLKGNLELGEIPGHRIGMLDEPRVQSVAEQIVAALKSTPQNLQSSFSTPRQ